MTPYEDKATLDDIGKAYGVTRERIRQIEAKGMKNLRKLLGLKDSKETAEHAPNSEIAS